MIRFIFAGSRNAVPPYPVGSMHVAIGFTNSEGFPHV
jgi:hypothetical protein